MKQTEIFKEALKSSSSQTELLKKLKQMRDNAIIEVDAEKLSDAELKKMIQLLNKSDII